MNVLKTISLQPAIVQVHSDFFYPLLFLSSKRKDQLKQE